jgi:PKD repeat protein
MKKRYLFLLLCYPVFLPAIIYGQVVCTAGFYLDKTASTPYNAVLVNTSTSSNVISPDSMIYKWDWNDGSSFSYAKFPTHIYTVTGLRRIRLEVKNSFSTCSDSIMIMIVIDSNGVFHKTNTNYNVKVVVPASSGIKNNSDRNIAFINAAYGDEFIIIPIQDFKSGGIITGNIYSLDGKTILSVKEIVSNSSIKIPISYIQSGMYIIRITTPEKLLTLKILKP